jgi:hypothetical protein
VPPAAPGSLDARNAAPRAPSGLELARLEKRHLWLSRFEQHDRLPSVLDDLVEGTNRSQTSLAPENPGLAISKETPKDDPRQRSDKGSLKQTDKPRQGNPEKEQRSHVSKDDLEHWQKSDTH